MLTLTELSQKVNSYKLGKIDLDCFEEWFRAHSWGCYDRRGDVLSDAIAGIEMALSNFDLGDMAEQDLQQGLANAVCPFARARREQQFVRPMLDRPNPWRSSGPSNHLFEVSVLGL